MLRSDLCDCSDAYVVVKVTITTAGANNRDRKGRSLPFKNNALFIRCISKINNLLIDNAHDLDVIMPMYNLIECSKNCRKATGSLWNYYRDEPNNPPADNYNADPITNSTSFKYQSSIIVKILDNDKDDEIVVPLKYLSNFWKRIDMQLINFEINLILTWYESCILTTHVGIRDATPALAALNAPTNSTFTITYTKLHVPLVTLSTQDDNQLLVQLKTRFKRTIIWNKYRSNIDKYR